MQYGMGNAFKPHTSTSTTRWARKKNGYGVVPVGYLQCSMGIAVCVVQVVHNAITQSLQINVYLETTYWECETPSSHTLYFDTLSEDALIENDLHVRRVVLSTRIFVFFCTSRRQGGPSIHTGTYTFVTGTAATERK